MPIPRDPKASPASRSLNDRVQEQIDAATSKLSPNKRPRRHAERPALLGGNGPQELRALQRVFREMGRSQRAARRQAGLAPSSVVREAAQAFRRAPSFTTLVGVAASLDEGAMWPTAFALTELTAADEATITALVKKAVS